MGEESSEFDVLSVAVQAWSMFLSTSSTHSPFTSSCPDSLRLWDFHVTSFFLPRSGRAKMQLVSKRLPVSFSWWTTWRTWTVFDVRCAWGWAKDRLWEGGLLGVHFRDRLGPPGLPVPIATAVRSPLEPAILKSWLGVYSMCFLIGRFEGGTPKDMMEHPHKHIRHTVFFQTKHWSKVLSSKPTIWSDPGGTLRECRTVRRVCALSSSNPFQTSFTLALSLSLSLCLYWEEI